MQRTKTIGRHRVQLTVRETGTEYGALDTPQKTADYARECVPQDGREHVIGIYLDTQQNPICWWSISTGSRASSITHPVQVFRPGVLVNAHSVILIHNHPTGDPTPSVEDHQVTARLVEAGHVIGIRVLDHVILGNNDHRSFQEYGWMP